VIVHRILPPCFTLAVPFITPPSTVISTIRLLLLPLMVMVQPLRFRVPVPLATSTPLQQKRYAPVDVLIRTTFPGFELSCTHKLNTVTGNVHVAVFPAVSVAVQVTVVVPTGNIEPDGGTQATVTPGQLSFAVGVV